MFRRSQALAFLAVGIVAASQSGNLVRIGTAAPAAIAGWRLLLATVLLLPFALRQRALLARLTRQERWLLLAAGAALAAHFITWISAIQQTTVANTASLLAIAPVLTAIGGRLLFGERLAPSFLAALVCGCAGVVVIGSGDLVLRADQLAGDATALLCALFFAVYLLLGRRLGRSLPTQLYVVVLYGVAALLCFGWAAATGQPIWYGDGRNWLCFVALALIPTLIGHTAVNNALRHFAAGRVAVATLAEPPLAGAVAWLVWAEPITRTGAAGYLLIALAVLLLAVEQIRSMATVPRGQTAQTNQVPDSETRP